jgi:hypothetical protein
MLNTRAVCKVCGLTLLLRVRTVWRCGDGLFFGIPPLASDSLLTTLHPLLENVLQTVDHCEISYLGAPFSWFEKPKNRMGARSELNSVFGLEKVDRWNPIRTNIRHTAQISPHVISGFFQPWKGGSEAINFEVISGLQHVSRSGWSVVRSASLAKGGTSKKRPSQHLHKVPIRSNKMSPRTFQTALV